MELRSHATIIKNGRWFIVLFTLLVTVAAVLFAVFRPVSYQAVNTFEVLFVNRPTSETEYQYGGYYEQKGAESYTQHLMSLLQSPSIVAEIYETAELGYTVDSFSGFTGRFRSKQLSAQSFSVTFSDYSEDSARHLSSALSEVIVKHSGETGSINEERIFYVNSLEPVIAQTQLPVVLVSVIGLFAGLIGSVILVYLREYFRV